MKETATIELKKMERQQAERFARVFKGLGDHPIEKEFADRLAEVYGAGEEGNKAFMLDAQHLALCFIDRAGLLNFNLDDLMPLDGPPVKGKP